VVGGENAKRHGKKTSNAQRRTSNHEW
jgi:hypothetical protein